MMLKSIFTPLVLTLWACSLYATPIEDTIEKAATGKHRSSENIARNSFRHPVETLSFFGLKDSMTVIEIAPGGMWYTEILAPVLKEKGKFIAAGYDPDLPGQPEYRYSQTKKLEQRFAAEPQFSKAEISRFSPPKSMNLAKPDSVDMVLTNVMDSPYPNGIAMCQSGVAKQTLTGRRSHNDHYNIRNRLGQAIF